MNLAYTGIASGILLSEQALRNMSEATLALAKIPTDAASHQHTIRGSSGGDAFSQTIKSNGYGPHAFNRHAVESATPRRLFTITSVPLRIVCVACTTLPGP